MVGLRVGLHEKQRRSGLVRARVLCLLQRVNRGFLSGGRFGFRVFGGGRLFFCVSVWIVLDLVVCDIVVCVFSFDLRVLHERVMAKNDFGKSRHQGVFGVQIL